MVNRSILRNIRPLMEKQNTPPTASSYVVDQLPEIRKGVETTTIPKILQQFQYYYYYLAKINYHK